MTPEQIGHIRNSWSLMASATDDVSLHFYIRLFELDPSLRSLFASTDMTEQGEKLTSMLGVIVRGVDDLPKLRPTVEALGRRHAEYGVVDQHYDMVGTALLSTFHQVLGPNFSIEARAAWEIAFGEVAALMKRAGSQVA